MYLDYMTCKQQGKRTFITRLQNLAKLGTKGQLISEWIYEVIVSSKVWT